jgi:hypothetical protein
LLTLSFLGAIEFFVFFCSGRTNFPCLYLLDVGPPYLSHLPPWSLAIHSASYYKTLLTLLIEECIEENEDLAAIQALVSDEIFQQAGFDIDVIRTFSGL